MSDDELPSLQKLMLRVSSKFSASNSNICTSDNISSKFFRSQSNELISYFLGKREGTKRRLEADESFNFEISTDLNEAVSYKHQCYPNNLPIFVNDRTSDLLIPAFIVRVISGTSPRSFVYEVEQYNDTKANVHHKYIVTRDNRLFYTGKILPLEEALQSASVKVTSASIDWKKLLEKHEPELLDIAKGTSKNSRDLAFFQSSKSKASLYSCTGRGVISFDDHEALSRYFCTEWFKSLEPDTIRDIRTRFESNLSKQNFEQFRQLFQQYVMLVLVPEMIIFHALGLDESLSRDQAEAKLLVTDKCSKGYIECLYASRSLIRWSHQNQ